MLIQASKAEEYLDKLNKYIYETEVLLSSERMECASRYQPEFVSTCSVLLTQKGAEISMRFNSYPYWLYDVEWNGGVHVKIDGYNGFEGVFIDKEKGVEISNKMYNISCPIKYVHELQHALRLCGLSELAENLKVL